MGKKKVIEKDAELQKGAADKKEETSRSKKAVRSIDTGKVYITSSYNNTIITVTDTKGDVVAWASSGSTGFSGPKKATPFASSKVVASIAEKVDRTGPKVVELYVSGIGPGRDSAIRSLIAHGFEIESIRDVTPIAHNGPRKRKSKRQ